MLEMRLLTKTKYDLVRQLFDGIPMTDAHVKRDIFCHFVNIALGLIIYKQQEH